MGARRTRNVPRRGTGTGGSTGTLQRVLLAPWAAAAAAAVASGRAVREPVCGLRLAAVGAPSSQSLQYSGVSIPACHAAGRSATLRCGGVPAGCAMCVFAIVEARASGGGLLLPRGSLPQGVAGIPCNAPLLVGGVQRGRGALPVWAGLSPPGRADALHAAASHPLAFCACAHRCLLGVCGSTHSLRAGTFTPGACAVHAASTASATRAAAPRQACQVLAFPLCVVP